MCADASGKIKALHQSVGSDPIHASVPSFHVRRLEETLTHPGHYSWLIAVYFVYLQKFHGADDEFNRALDACVIGLLRLKFGRCENGFEHCAHVLIVLGIAVGDALNIVVIWIVADKVDYQFARQKFRSLGSC